MMWITLGGVNLPATFSTIFGTTAGNGSTQHADQQRHFDEIAIGDTTTYTRLVTNQEVEAFAAISGDHNPLHLDPAYAATTAFGECIAHGMLTGALISAAIAMQLPGPGSVYLSQNIQFRAPVMLGDTLTVTLTVTD